MTTDVSGPRDELLAQADQWSPTTDQWYGNRPNEAHRLIASLAAALRSQIAETQRLEQQNTGLGIRVQEGWARIEALEVELAEARAEIEQSQLRLIEATNPGIDMDQVRRSRAAAPDAVRHDLAPAASGNHVSVPAGEVLWRGMTFQCQGCEAAGHSFISPNSLDVPPGTEVVVSRAEAATEEEDGPREPNGRLVVPIPLEEGTDDG